ncbi:MAG: 1-deoxy-D-xylulose-5-phosphate synthase [Firmicutes bacterium]|nr:1-deoxy-D-xylulose-5-phosphate synthase [Bacillota bacterium]
MLIEKIKTPNDLKKLSHTDLERYASEVRNFIINITQENGGHLSSNLGAVELTIALHYTFDSPIDKFIFDVGHQSYTHKLITGRYEILKNLRTDGGASGFPSTNESNHDHFISGHSSNSLSLALGLARARDKLHQNHHIIPIIGDGAFTGGMIYEALNDIGESKSKLIIILNDNKMSISENVGAMSKYLAKLRLSRRFNKLRQNIKKSASVFPLLNKKQSYKRLNLFKARLKSLFIKNRLFENFGVTYYGPFDGHDILQMVQVFEKVANKSIVDDKPVIIHIISQKGKGMIEAENEPDKYHGLNSSLMTSNIDSSFSNDLADELIELANEDNRIVAITAAMPSGTGLDKFAIKHPDKYYDVSIAEQHATTLCAGLAKGGMKPLFAVYSTFLQRAFDQILHDVCLNNLSVVFAIDRAGVTGSDGVTHQGVFDLSYLNLMPNLTILTPKNGIELKNMLRYAFNKNGPVAIRYPKSYNTCEPIATFKAQEFDNIEKWETLKKSNGNIYILACGSRMIELLSALDLNITIINCRTIKPLDYESLDYINNPDNLIIILEDNISSGGFSSHVLDYLYTKNPRQPPLIKILNHKTTFSDIRSIDNSLKDSNITIENIKKTIDEFLA